MQAWLDLADRVEAAKHGSTDLDVAIFRLLKPEYAGDEWRPYGTGMRHRYDSSDERNLPDAAASWSNYTYNLHAAMSLVPVGWHANVAIQPDGKGVAVIQRVKGSTQAATPALAICAASLRARAVK